MRSLQHLAKYLTRVACNVDAQPIPHALAELLVKDLYVWIEGGRPSEVFARHAAAMPEIDAHTVELAFGALDRLEAKVRAHDQPALRAACEVALRIASAIHRSFEAHE